MKPVIDAIYSRLGSATGDGSFHALVSGRYYHVEAPQNSAFPLCAFRLMDVSNEDQFDGTKVNRGTIQFTIYCESKSGAAVALAIEEALFGLVDQQTLSVSGGTYRNVSMQCISRGVPFAADEFFILNTTYAIFTTRT